MSWIKKAIKKAVKKAEKAGKEVGKGAEKVGKEIGKGGEKVGKEVGKGAERGGKELKKTSKRVWKELERWCDSPESVELTDSISIRIWDLVQDSEKLVFRLFDNLNKPMKNLYSLYKIDLEDYSFTPNGFIKSPFSHNQVQTYMLKYSKKKLKEKNSNINKYGVGPGCPQ